MNDKFLYQLREKPDAAFENSLRTKLNQMHPEPDRGVKNIFDILFSSKRLVQVAAVLVVGLITAISFSPVRAYLAALAAEIGGQLFSITEDYPGDNVPGDETIIEPQILSLEEGLEAYPYEIRMPDNIPPEYVLNTESVRAFVGEDGGPFSNMIQIEWVNVTRHARSKIILTVTDRDLSISETIAPDSSQEISLDETHTAVLIQGGWDVDQQAWNVDGSARLKWLVGDLTYELLANPEQVSIEQMVKIALSTLE